METYKTIATPQPKSDHSDEWYANRRKGIGGSDAAAVLGKSRWKTPFQVWLEKDKKYIDEFGVERLSYLDDRTTNEAMEQGARREPSLIQEYADKTGKTIVQPGSLVHPDYDYVCVNLDGLIPDDRIIECKTSETGMEYNRETGKWEKAWDPDTGEVPTAYYFQCQHGMMIAVARGLIPADDPLCDLFVSISGKAIQIFTIKGDPELWEAMLARYEDFWGYVQRVERPDLTTATDIDLAYPTTHKKNVQAPASGYTQDQAMGDVLVNMFDELRLSYQNQPEVVNSIGDAQWALAPLGTQTTDTELSVTERLSRYKAIGKLLQILNGLQDRCTKSVKEFMADSEILIDESGEVLCTWKMDAKGRENFDKARFKKDHPEMYNQYVWHSEPSRRFLPK